MVRKVHFIIIFIGCLVILGITSIFLKQPAFIWNFRNAVSPFEEVYVKVETKPQVILFADQFEIKISVIFDTRRYDPSSLEFVLPTKDLIVLKEKTERKTSGSVIKVTKVLELQCLACLPRDTPYTFREVNIMIRDKNGEMKKFTDTTPPIRVASRLLPEDFKIFPYSLWPQRLTLSSMELGMDLIPYFIFGGIISILLSLILLGSTLLPQQKKAKIQPAPETQSDLKSKLLAELIRKLQEDKISLYQASVEAYLLLREVSDERARKIQQGLMPIVFGPQELLAAEDKKNIYRILSEALDLLIIIERR